MIEALQKAKLRASQQGNFTGDEQRSRRASTKSSKSVTLESQTGESSEDWPSWAGSGSGSDGTQAHQTLAMRKLSMKPHEKARPSRKATDVSMAAEDMFSDQSEEEREIL